MNKITRFGCRKEGLDVGLKDSELTVMSYNLRFFSNSRGWEGRDPSLTMSTVLKTDPDVVGFQEVNQKSLGGWDDHFPMLTSNGYSQVRGEDSQEAHFIRQDLFYKTQKFTELESGTVFFKPTAEGLHVPNLEHADESLDHHGKLGRSCTYVALRDKTTGAEYLLVDVHLHYGGTGAGHEEDDKLRRYEIRTLLSWLETKSYPNQIVFGDMNSHYQGTGQGAVNMKVYTDAGFEISAETATVKGDTGGTLAITGRTIRAEWTFDYIMTRGDLQASYYTVVDNPVDANGSYPSDHIPILAKIVCTK